MKIHLRAVLANGHHTRFTVFMNGANCGELCMTEAEAVFFYNALGTSSFLKPGEFLGSGIWSVPKEKKE